MKIPHTCQYCQFHTAILVGVEEDEDGTTEIFRHECAKGNIIPSASVKDFGCGLFEESK